MNQHPNPTDLEAAAKVGPLGRLGRKAANNTATVFAIWALLAVGLGFFAPKVEHALSGAGWEATGSESVATRDAASDEFGGMSSYGLMAVVYSDTYKFGDPQFDTAIEKAATQLKSDERISQVVLPQPGMSVSKDGSVAVVRAGAADNPTEMVRAADDLKEELPAAEGVEVVLTGASGMWSDFNVANREAMMKSELISWPITLAILVLAFGSVVAAGLPLLLTILSLVASAGTLYLTTKFFDVSIWAMNFALMFALALGIDYALFIVMRFRGALFGSDLPKEDAVALTMDTAGKAVLFSGVTVLISLSAVMLVLSPAFRSMALGIMVSVLFVLAAALTLLPAVLGKLGHKIDKASLPWVHSGEHRSPRFERWGEKIWRRPALAIAGSLTVLLLLTIPVFGLQTGMPSIKVVPEEDGSRIGYQLVQESFGTGAPGELQVIVDKTDAKVAAATAQSDQGVAAVMPAVPGSADRAMISVIPKTDPSDVATGATIERLRADLPTSAIIGGAAAENYDLEESLASATPLVIGVVLVLGFLLLLVALQAPIIAIVGVLTNLLAVGAAFGVARLVFQEGHGSGLLGFEAQGFLDAWGPVFFFAMIFAISMDYTVFLLSSAKEHWDRSHDPRDAMIGGLAHSGRVIFAAAAVMVAVFFTFALSGPLPPKEMGVILGVAVLLDAFLVRLLLVPALLRVLGKWAWWLPKPLDRVLPNVSFGH